MCRIVPSSVVVETRRLSASSARKFRGGYPHGKRRRRVSLDEPRRPGTFAYCDAERGRTRGKNSLRRRNLLGKLHPGGARRLRGRSVARFTNKRLGSICQRANVQRLYSRQQSSPFHTGRTRSSRRRRRPNLDRRGADRAQRKRRRSSLKRVNSRSVLFSPPLFFRSLP